MADGAGGYSSSEVAPLVSTTAIYMTVNQQGVVFAIAGGILRSYTPDGAGGYTSAVVDHPGPALSSSHSVVPTFMATDRAGDLFVTYTIDGSTQEIAEFPVNGVSKVVYSEPNTDSGNPVSWDGMTVDTAGDIFVIRRVIVPGGPSKPTMQYPALVRLAPVGSGYATSFEKVADGPSDFTSSWQAIAAASGNQLFMTTFGGFVTVQGPAVSTASAPSVPQSVAASAGDSSAVVSWAAPDSDGGSPVQGYAVARVTGSGSSTVSTQVCATDASTLSCSVGGLTNGSSYRLQVRAFNAEGYSKPVGVRVTPSVPVAFTTDLPATTYAAVKSTMTLSVEVAGDPAAVLQWQTSTDGGTTWTNMAGGKNVTSISRLVRQKNIGNLFRVRAIQKGAAPVFSTVTTLTTPKAVPQD